MEGLVHWLQLFLTAVKVLSTYYGLLLPMSEWVQSVNIKKWMIPIQVQLCHNFCLSFPHEQELYLNFKTHIFQALLRDICTVMLKKKDNYSCFNANSYFCCLYCTLTAANIKCHAVFLLMNFKINHPKCFTFFPQEWKMEISMWL